MNSDIVEALLELGLEISDVQYKYPPRDEFSMGDVQTKFVIKGAFYDEADLKQLMDEIHILRAARHNKHPAAKDLFDQLKTITEITK